MFSSLTLEKDSALDVSLSSEGASVLHELIQCRDKLTTQSNIYGDTFLQK